SLFSLHETRRAPVPINRELTDDGAQPPAKASAARIVRELARGTPVAARAQSVEFGPDRVGQLFRLGLARARRARSRKYGRAVLFYQLVPRRLVAALARRDQQQLVRVQRVEKFADLACRSFGAAAQKVLLDRRTQARRERVGVERARTSGARKHALRTVTHELFDVCRHLQLRRARMPRGLPRMLPRTADEGMRDEGGRMK